MLWFNVVKSLHIVFVASWFAGLFYLPRIYVNLAMVPPESIARKKLIVLCAPPLRRLPGYAASNRASISSSVLPLVSGRKKAAVMR